jgi:hypothetical protein
MRAAVAQAKPSIGRPTDIANEREKAPEHEAEPTHEIALRTICKFVEVILKPVKQRGHRPTSRLDAGKSLLS